MRGGGACVVVWTHIPEVSPFNHRGSRKGFLRGFCGFYCVLTITPFAKGQRLPVPSCDWQ